MNNQPSITLAFRLPSSFFLYIYQRGFLSFTDLQTNNLKNITQEEVSIQMSPCQFQFSIRSLKCTQRFKTDLWPEMKNRLKRRGRRRVGFGFTMAANWQRRMEITSLLCSAKKTKEKGWNPDLLSFLLYMRWEIRVLKGEWLYYPCF